MSFLIIREYLRSHVRMNFMGSRQLGDRQMNFLARLYERGTGDSIPVTVSFHNDNVLIYLEENGAEPIAVPLDEWEVKVGGSSEDKIVLSAHQTGDTLICGDELFLTAIAEATNNTDIIKQIARAKKRNSTRIVRQSTGIVAVILVLTMFGGCVTLGFLDATRHRAGDTTRTTEPADQQAVPEETTDEGSEVFDEKTYMKKVQKRIKQAWHPPATSKQAKVIVHFTVDKSGQTSQAKIAKSSGDKACDASALQAITDVSPLPILGEGSPPSVQIEYTFDLNGKMRKTASPSEPSTKRFD